MPCPFSIIFILRARMHFCFVGSSFFSLFCVERTTYCASQYIHASLGFNGVVIRSELNNPCVCVIIKTSKSIFLLFRLPRIYPSLRFVRTLVVNVVGYHYYFPQPRLFFSNRWISRHQSTLELLRRSCRLRRRPEPQRRLASVLEPQRLV